MKGKDKSDIRHKVEHSSSGRYVIRTEAMKDPVVRVHISRGYTPSCDNNHNYDNIVDKEKQNRVINQMQRKKNKDKLLEKSRLQLEQTQKELEAAYEYDNNQSARKSSSKKIILPKKLVNDIILINEEIQQFQKEQVRSRYEEELEVEDNKIRKQQRQITQQSMENVQRSLQLINSIKVTHDPKEQQKHQEYMKQKVGEINNKLWEKQKTLITLLSQRDELRQKIETLVSNYFKDEENARLLQINSHVLKFFRVIFGRDYSMRLRMDKILQNNDAEMLKKQIQKTKEIKRKPKPQDIFIPYNQSERYKEKLGNKMEDMFLNTISAGSKTTTSQLSHTGMMHKSLDLKLVPIYQAKHLDILETYFQKDVLQHLYDFYFNPITENLEYYFKSETWDQLFEQLKQNKLPKENITLGSPQRNEQQLFLPQISSNRQRNELTNLDQSDTQKASNQQQIKSMKAINNEKNEKPTQSFQQIQLADTNEVLKSLENNSSSEKSQNELYSNLGSNQELQNQLYSKEFYQYLREYSIISETQNKLSKEEILKKVESRLEQCRDKHDFFEQQLDLIDNSNIVKKSSQQKRKSLLNSINFLSQQFQKQRDSQSIEQISNEKIKTPPLLSVHSSFKDNQQLQKMPLQLDTPTLSKYSSSKAMNNELQDLQLVQTISKKVNFQNKQSQSIDTVLEQTPINKEYQQQDQQKLPKIRTSKSVSQIGKLKKVSQDAFNKCMDKLANQAVSEETNKYLNYVNKLYKQCKIESYKTKKVKNESIKKKNIIQKKYRNIDKEFKKLASL
ncbi:hypothetical protein TTHERM_00151060 (macronuclear) [Tetrahymena thermophila SB210]|uniref:Uncharacterized protein n=1 Tax=Tetrahymena thermophila (strain SB210) TaxID=312017 RepID=I7LWC9_TETTS|nr:hypothetical protein TTHERM_00151060 [Tetrahymena thermophila SB210]EAS01396.2 hypothetical protein TTHERM_00151060 [Tetrahymena thermophila SB210]|eukprot:XP_001021642.2 hypothetical protein TTHERM_00151060 [Tetrahymena thermophila SB210]